MSDYILPEIVSEILLRLPAKSLLKCRCVCKEWCSLISSPTFISDHLSLSSSSPDTHYLVRHFSKLLNKETYTICAPNLGECTPINYPSTGPEAGFYSRVVGYCHGVLCLSDDLFGYSETIVLWNPSIRRAINVPTPRVVFDTHGSYMFVLGFGYDYVTNDYKIVRVAYRAVNGYHIPPKVEIFSVSSGKWRFVNSHTSSVITERFWSQAIKDDRIVHWVGYTYNNSSNGGGDDDKPLCLIVSFDLSSESFGELSLPESLAVKSPIQMIAKMFRGAVSVCCYDRVVPCDSCAIWVMREYGNVESWVNEYNVRVEEGGLGMVLGMPRIGEILLSTKNGDLVLYNCEKRTRTSTGICGTTYSFFVDKYVESLVLMGKGRVVRGRALGPDYDNDAEFVESQEMKRHMSIMVYFRLFVY